MTVRISQDLGLNKIVNLSKQLGIYENPNELLSISLGSAETTLLKLTSAYCSFVNGGKLVNPKLIDRSKIVKATQYLKLRIDIVKTAKIFLFK